MIICPLPQCFTVCQIDSIEKADLAAPFTFLSRTDEEISLVCPTHLCPAETVNREDGWKGFAICGVLDFSLIGILAKISSLLAENGISIFALSTYNTDYVLVKEENFSRALALLQNAGWVIAQ